MEKENSSLNCFFNTDDKISYSCESISRDKYKFIYKHKDEVQAEFITNLGVKKLTKEKFLTFVFSLMCEFADGKNTKYFTLPNLSFVDNEDSTLGMYSWSENKIEIDEKVFNSLLLDNSPQMFLKLINIVGHEMTHFKQYERLREKKRINHNERFEKEGYFIQGSDFIDESLVKMIKSTLTPRENRIIRKEEFSHLVDTLNYAEYYFSDCEAEARKGGNKFLKNKMDLWINSFPAENEQWQEIIYCYSTQNHVKNEKIVRKFWMKHMVKINAKFDKLVPLRKIELMTYYGNALESQKFVMQKTMSFLDKQTTKFLLNSFWIAVNDGNDLMLPQLTSILQERLSKEEFDEFMHKTLKIACRGSSLRGSSKKTIGCVSVLLSYDNFKDEEIAYFLNKALDYQQIECVEMFFNMCDDVSKKQNVANLIYDLISKRILFRELENVEILYEQLKMVDENFVGTEATVEYKNDIECVIKICNTLMRNLSKDNEHKQTLERMNQKFKKQYKVLDTLVKRMNDCEENIHKERD